MEAKTKELLNKFADSQPALQDKDLPHAEAPVQLGDLLQDLEDAATAAQASADGAAAAAYVPTTSADWVGDPADIQEALDRLASAVAGLLAAPIP